MEKVDKRNPEDLVLSSLFIIDGCWISFLLIFLYLFSYIFDYSFVCLFIPTYSGD